jgi:hypothetical protein
MAEKIKDALGIHLKEVEPSSKSYKGAFFTLKSAGLVDPLDLSRYNIKQNSIFKSQGLVLFYTLFWAHLIDVGSFLKPERSRITFYLVASGVPSLMHALYSATRINDTLSELDEKYAESYEKYYMEKLKKKDDLGQK